MKTSYWLVVIIVGAIYLLRRRSLGQRGAAIVGADGGLSTPLAMGLQQKPIYDASGNVIGYDWFDVTDQAGDTILSDLDLGALGLTKKVPATPGPGQQWYTIHPGGGRAPYLWASGAGWYSSQDLEWDPNLNGGRGGWGPWKGAK